MTDGPLDQRERDELCDLLLQLGPDAPTLCEGWTTLDLGAHLVIREREPRSAAGILSERFAAYTAKRQQAWADKGLDAVVDRLRTPPLVPWRVPKLRNLLNLTEYAVHHEDVRRANGMAPRTDRPNLDGALWKLLGGSARMATRELGVGLDLARPGGERKAVHKGEPRATLTGEPVELALYLTGRTAHSEAELSGPPQAVAAVESATFGL